jgi:hypothetical protein
VVEEETVVVTGTVVGATLVGGGEVVEGAAVVEGGAVVEAGPLVVVVVLGPLPELHAAAARASAPSATAAHRERTLRPPRLDR